MGVHIDYDADVDCLDSEPDDSDVDADAEPELADSEDLATVVDTEDREVMVVGIEHSLHMNVDCMTPEVELLKLYEFPTSH